MYIYFFKDKSSNILAGGIFVIINKSHENVRNKHGLSLIVHKSKHVFSSATDLKNTSITYNFVLLYVIDVVLLYCGAGDMFLYYWENSLCWPTLKYLLL